MFRFLFDLLCINLNVLWNYWWFFCDYSNFFPETLLYDYNKQWFYFLSNDLQHIIFIRKNRYLEVESMQLLIRLIYFSDWIPLFNDVKNKRRGLDLRGDDGRIKVSNLVLFLSKACKEISFNLWSMGHYPIIIKFQLLQCRDFF